MALMIRPSNFLDLVDCKVVRGDPGVIYSVEPHHHWISHSGLLHQPTHKIELVENRSRKQKKFPQLSLQPFGTILRKLLAKRLLNDP
jgi:hypothetical protein